MRFKSYFLTLSFLATSISLFAAPSPSASPSGSPKVESCRNNPDYDGEGSFLCLGSCPTKVTKKPNGDITRTERVCIYGVPPGSKGTKATCHCADKKIHPKK